nr:lysine histidine transporter-like 8 [Ipomoea batatas]
MGESSDEVWSVPITPRLPTSVAPTPPIVSCPPLGSTLRKALKMTKLMNPQDACRLPITQSRNGNAYYAAFHTLCSGIGIQALVLPVAFTVLGWVWGIICLTVAFIWQLYTLYVMVHLHENVESEAGYSRYSKYMQSAGTCTTLIIIGGSTSKMLYQTLCGAACTSKPLTNVEWYLVFTCAAVLLSQLPNLNSIAGVSLLAALTAIAYCTLIWALSVAQGSLPNVSYDRLRNGKQIARIFDVLNALGIIAFAFRGHNHEEVRSGRSEPGSLSAAAGLATLSPSSAVAEASSVSAVAMERGRGIDGRLRRQI